MSAEVICRVFVLTSVSLVVTVWVNRLCSGISPCERLLFQPIYLFCELRLYVYIECTDESYVEQEIVGDDTTALDSVLQADVWRHKLIKEEAEINAKLEGLEKKPAPEANGDGAPVSTEAGESEKDELSARLGDIQKKLVDMEAETGPARAGLLLAGLGFSDADQKMATRSFSGGWRMRLALARALFVKPDLLMLDEPSNMLDLNAIAWLEDYLQTWQGTILVV